MARPEGRNEAGLLFKTRDNAARELDAQAAKEARSARLSKGKSRGTIAEEAAKRVNRTERAGKKFVTSKNARLFDED